MLPLVDQRATGGTAVQDKSSLKPLGGSTRPRLLTEKQAALYIGMSRSFLRQSRMNGRRQNRTSGPPFLKIGRKVLYLAEDLDAWLLEHRHEG
jgi:predicted DNA-binding transcriptional regulator AlpA